MAINPQTFTIRAKKISVLIRSARQSSGKDVEECASAMGIPPSQFLAYESGEIAPSLPEMEMLAYHLNTSIDHFWGGATFSEEKHQTRPLDSGKLLNIRQRAIGVLIRQARLETGFSLEQIAERTSLPADRLKAYESSEIPIPFPELEAIAQVLGRSIKEFQDQHGPVGAWALQQKALQGFAQMPPDLQDFVAKPVNWPYLEVARRLSEMSAERLRSVAEGLLEITL